MLIVLGVLLGVGILYSIGAVLAVVGLLLTLLGSPWVGRPVAGRRTYW